MSPMLPLPADDPPGRPDLFAQILRTLRRRRGLPVKEVAHRMNLPKRTYELFESGAGRLNLTRLQQFADAVDCDAYAIVASLAFGDPAFALRCADMKLMTIAVMVIQELNANVGDDLARLDSRVVMEAMDRACDHLAGVARARALPPVR